MHTVEKCGDEKRGPLCTSQPGDKLQSVPVHLITESQGKA